MFRLAKIEFKKALNYKFYIVLCLFTILLLIGVIRYQSISPNEMFQKGNAFHGWFYSVTEGSFHIVEYLTPLIVVMAYGDNLFMEFKSGYIRMSCIRTSLTRYVQVKFIVNGIVAFFTVAIPSTILLLVCSILFTREIPTQNMYRVFWNPHGEFTSIYYNHPYGFMFAEILIMGLFAFSYSCLSFAISFYTKHKTVTLLFPFFVYMLFQTYCDRAGLISIQPRLSLLFYLESSHNLTVNIMESVAIVVISIILIKIKPKGDLVL